MRKKTRLETKELLIELRSLLESELSKDSEFYGSDADAEMAATYHSVIGTIKHHGSSIWNFIGTFFQKYL